MLWKIIAILLFFVVASPLPHRGFRRRRSCHRILIQEPARLNGQYPVQGLGEHLAFSITYLNEGHQSDQHRNSFSSRYGAHQHDGKELRFWRRESDSTRTVIRFIPGRVCLPECTRCRRYFQRDRHLVRGKPVAFPVARQVYRDHLRRLSATFGIGYLLDARA